MHRAVSEEQYNDNGRMNLETLQQEKRYGKKSDSGIKAEALHGLLAKLVSHRSQHDGNDRRHACNHAGDHCGAAEEGDGRQQGNHRDTGWEDVRKNGDNRAEGSFFPVAEIGCHLRGDRARKRVGEREHLPEFIVAQPVIAYNGFVPYQRNNGRTTAVAEYSGSDHAER